MSNTLLIPKARLDNIGDAIRYANGEETTYYPSEMPEAIRALKKELVSLSTTVNGEFDPSDYDADGFDSVTVNVPNTYAAGDEGKVVANGALVSQTARAGENTANGTYDTTLNNSVTVDVSGGGGSIPTYTQAQWDALTTEQKQALGFAVIVTAESGFKRGDYVYGGDYEPIIVES